jgi:Anti-sigma factor NepR
MTECKSPTPGLRADQVLLKQLGRELARQYAELAAEPAPETFLRLLEAADRISLSKETKS